MCVCINKTLYITIMLYLNIKKYTHIHIYVHICNNNLKNRGHESESKTGVYRKGWREEKEPER